MTTEAQIHIQWLSGEPDPLIAWQTFDDSKLNTYPARGFHARLSEVAGRLAIAQQNGCGVFIAVNATDGKRRRKENIVSYRAAFLDFDGVPLPTAWPIEPGLIVNSSPGKYQVWWLLEPGTDFAAWTAMQLDLIARYKADPKCGLITQVGRCAGFLHQKGASFRVRIIDIPRDERYSLQAFSAAFGIDLEEAKARHAEKLKPARPIGEPPPGGWDNEDDIRRATEWLQVEANWYKANSGGMSLFKVACGLGDYAISPGLAENLMVDHCPAYDSTWADDHVQQKIANAYKSRRNEIGCRSIQADLDALNRLLESLNGDS